MDYLKNSALVLTIIGALNWGLVGFFNFNLVSFIFGDLTILSKIVYMLVGISGIIVAYIASTFWTRHDPAN